MWPICNSSSTRHLGVTVAANDLNGGGVVNVVDVQIEINAVLGSGLRLST
jgi:hypothetical protein